MNVLKALDKVKIGENTVVAVDDPYNRIRNGMGIIDAEGNNHIVLSVGLTNFNKTNLDKTNILIKGDFNSNKIIVY